ncbi:MAG TPA: hypothetical protein VFU47_11990, partial [Armatimonadota bacterium]|nr:hypothetical protein [Armatimonadota bacterium]
MAKRPGALPFVPIIEDVLASHLEEADWRQAVRGMNKELPQTGNGLIRVTWETETVRRPVTRVEWNEERYRDLLDGGADPDRAYAGAVETDASGKAKVYLEFQEQVIHDGVRLKVVRWEDMLILPATCRDPRKAWGIGERVVERGADLLRGAQDGKYHLPTVREILKGGSDEAPDDQRDRNEELGVEDPEAFDEEVRYREYLFYEFCLLDDLNGDDEEEWYVVAVHYPTGKVARCQYLMYEHGRPYYVPFRYLTREGQLWGGSVPERLAVIQDGITSAVNQFFDLVDLLVASGGNFFFDQSAGLDVTRFVFQPGRPVRLTGSVGGIQQMQQGPGIAQ